MNTILSRLGWAVVVASGLFIQACTTPGPANNPDIRTAGMGVYKDPGTGRFVEPPVGAPPGAAAAGKTGSTPAGRLIETPGQTPAGGYRLDMQGRSGHDAVATKDAEGRITVHHLPAPFPLQP